MKKEIIHMSLKKRRERFLSGFCPNQKGPSNSIHIALVKHENTFRKYEKFIPINTLCWKENKFLSSPSFVLFWNTHTHIRTQILLWIFSLIFHVHVHHLVHHKNHEIQNIRLKARNFRISPKLASFSLFLSPWYADIYTFTSSIIQ